MTLQLHVTRRAAREIERAATWWQANRPAAPEAVARDLRSAVALLLVEPGLGAPVPQASAPGVRRFHLDRIRYWVYYRVRDERFELVSVWHSSRGAKPAL